MNITVPNSMVTNDQVYKIKANGCSSIKIPSEMTAQATNSRGPRLSHLGHACLAGVFSAAGNEGIALDMDLLSITATYALRRR